MTTKVFLSGEIHTSWRSEIIKGCKALGIAIDFSSAVTDHAAADDCGPNILGEENKKIWHDHKSAKINAIRIRKDIEKADIVVVRFGDKYKQWNAAFDAGYSAALGKSLIVIHSDEHQHALKEIDAVALAVCEKPSQVVSILNYVETGTLSDQD